MENCAEIRDLRVSFGGAEVLHGITADFPLRGITVLLGRSGSGKSTLLRSLNRLNECFDDYDGSGSVKLLINGKMTEIYGDSAPEPAAVRRRAGMVFQVPNPLPSNGGNNNNGDSNTPGEDNNGTNPGGSTAEPARRQTRHLFRSPQLRRMKRKNRSLPLPRLRHLHRVRQIPQRTLCS